jgi:parvulin-like peptidyl-prolyl isomerase
MPTEKYKQAWKKFQDKMASLKKRRFEIFSNISKKLDEQKIESLRKKLENHE